MLGGVYNIPETHMSSGTLPIDCSCLKSKSNSPAQIPRPRSAKNFLNPQNRMRGGARTFQVSPNLSLCVVWLSDVLLIVLSHKHFDRRKVSKLANIGNHSVSEKQPSKKPDLSERCASAFPAKRTSTTMSRRVLSRCTHRRKFLSLSPPFVALIFAVLRCTDQLNSV